MSVYAHVVLGAAMGGLAPHPVAAFLIGAALHVPADVVAHYDFAGWKAELALALVSFALCAWLGDFRGVVIWGAVGGALPDAENLVAAIGLTRSRRRFFPAHTTFLAHGGPKRAWDIVFQSAAAALFLAWIIWAPAFAS